MNEHKVNLHKSAYICMRGGGGAHANNNNGMEWNGTKQHSKLRQF